MKNKEKAEARDDNLSMRHAVHQTLLGPGLVKTLESRREGERNRSVQYHQDFRTCFEFACGHAAHQRTSFSVFPVARLPYP